MGGSCLSNSVDMLRIHNLWYAKDLGIESLIRKIIIFSSELTVINLLALNFLVVWNFL